MAEATGRLLPTERGIDLVLFRSLALPVDEAWAFLTESELTERWFGPWEGDARTGGTIRIRMRFEAGEPPVRAQILACAEPHRLALRTADDEGGWRLTVTLEEDGEEDTLLRFAHHLEIGADVSEFGPGWEYYLDLLVAATEDAEEPMLHDYLPALSEAYASLRP